MMLRLIVLGILFTLCLAGEDYIPCSRCRPTKDQLPDEGEMACFKMKQTTSVVPGKVIKKCDSKCVVYSDYGDCLEHKEVCKTKNAEVEIKGCELEPVSTKVISQRQEQYGTIYQINSPLYFGLKNYPNNVFCVWNISNEGQVSFRIVDQMLQNATDDCDNDDCKCPDHMRIKMGGNEMKLCGSRRPDISNQMSSDGLHVEFCSDNAISSRGILVMAYRHEKMITIPTLPGVITEAKKRQAPDTCESRIESMSTEMSRMGCQYEYMMRMSQPGSACPDDSTIMSLVNFHDYMMTGFEQTMDMCDGMEVMSSRMPLMNNIESCAVDYLYRTRDCEFAKRLVNATNGELSDVARMISENNFPIRAPRWMEISRKKCK